MATTECSVEGCSSPVQALGYCTKHYSRFHRYGDPLKVQRQTRSGTCEVEGCEEQVKARGLCQLHYTRFLKSGDVGPPARIRRTPNQVCSVAGCDRKAVGLGMCNIHWKRWKVSGDVGPTESLRLSTEGACEIEGCNRPVLARRLCNRHYGSWKKYGDPLAAQPKVRNFCTIDGCERPAEGYGWCSKHYARWKSTGDPEGIRSRPSRTRFEWYEAGYRIVWVEAQGRGVREHRIVMEGIIGRSLLPGENVHHRNGVRDDNRPENLELWSRPQPSKARVVDLVAWAREIESTYGALVDGGVVT